MVNVRRHSAELRSPYAAQRLLSYSCSCAFVTDWHPVEREHLARGEIREHLATAHAGELELGPCTVCGTTTDHFRAISDLGTSWLCAAHTPKMSDAGPMALDTAQQALT